MLVIPSNHIASKNKYVALNEIAELPLYWFTRNENPAYYDKNVVYFSGWVFCSKIPEPKDSIMMLDKSLKAEVLPSCHAH